MIEQRPIRFISDQPAWYGRRSGYYVQLPRALAEHGHQVHTVTPSRGLAWRAAGKAWSVVRRLPRRQQTLTADELRFHAGWVYRPRTIAGILSVEQHLPALSYWREAPRRLIGTLHFPRFYWTGDQTRMLGRLRSAVVLYRADLDFFTSFVGRDRVRFIHHGVDTEFFTPAAKPAGGPPLLLCAGQFGRDFTQLERVAPIVLHKLRDAELHILLAPHADPAQLLPSLSRHPRVRIVSGIPDDQLLGLYQRAMLMLLPMVAAGASNAVVEALACGVPMVTTDVGGIRDYGGATLYPAVPRDDDAAFIDETLRLAGDESERRASSERMRQFAVTHLPWPQVAAEHWRAYQALAD